MLTGACDSCHKTTLIEDHLAGKTIRCKQCGQGWVRVALAQSIAESASAITERRPTSLPDTAMTADLPMTVDVPDVTFLLVAGACPRCGSPSFTKLKAKRGTTLTYDRECNVCGTRYMTIPAPESSIVRIAFQLSGVAVILGGVLAALIQLALTAGPARLGGGSFRLYGLLFSVMAGSRMFGMPQQMQELREKRLNEYQSSVGPDSPPPVELPRSPDVVALSGLFGILALVSPLFSSLLLVLLFGPLAIVFGVIALAQVHCGRSISTILNLAIVFGVIALAQSHRKGLIGTVLGIVGLVVWELVFVFVFQG